MRVLVVDDSALMRKHIRGILEEAGFEVETARNGEDALNKIPDFEPAVITLDINMPVMDGITCLSEIMQRFPTPVVMVSSLTEKGAEITFEAMELGAVDYVAKPGGTVSLNIRDVSEDIVDKVRAAGKARLRKAKGLRARLREQHKNTTVARSRERPAHDRKTVSLGRKRRVELVVIGVSTGGPGTVEEIITSLPADFPVPIVIAQHMPARFTQVFADRLNKAASLEVLEVNRPMAVQAGQVLVAKGDADVKMIRRNGKLMATSIPASTQYLWHPSVERLVESVKDVCDPKRVICVQLTGMGNDGAQSMSDLHEQGALTIAESEETSVVYGMPRALVELGGADCVLPSHEIAEQLIGWTMQT